MHLFNIPTEQPFHVKMPLSVPGKKEIKSCRSIPLLIPDCFCSCLFCLTPQPVVLFSIFSHYLLFLLTWTSPDPGCWPSKTVSTQEGDSTQELQEGLSMKERMSKWMHSSAIPDALSLIYERSLPLETITADAFFCLILLLNYQFL